VRQVKKSENAIFTSCGDRSNCYELWFDSYSNFDSICVYYGNNEEIFKNYHRKFDKALRRKGSKFQNFFYFFRNSSLFNSYDRIFILDDDIIIDSKGINNMFLFSEKYNLDICQPSFNSSSVISHEVTKQQKSSKGRYTNFVEVNTPLMTQKALKNLDSVYSDSLIGWGIDFLFTWINNDKQIPQFLCRKFAINDEISCINPNSRSLQSEGRELLKIPRCNERQYDWENYAFSISCPKAWNPLTLEKII